MRVPQYSRQIGSTALPSVRRTPQQEGAQVGQAIATVGAVVANFGGDLVAQHLEEQRQREDHAALTGATRALGELENQVLTSDDRGYLRTVTGKDVLDRQKRDQALELFDQQAGMITGSLTERQRLRFDGLREQRRRAVVDAMNDHGVREFTAYEKGEAIAGLETAVNLMIINADKPPRVNEELGRIAEIIDVHANALGLKGPAAKSAALLNFQSKGYDGVITRLIAQGKHADAEAWLEEAKAAKQLDGAAIARLEAKLAESTTDAAGLEAVDQVWAKLGPVTDDDGIEFDKMAAALRDKFKGETRKYDAAMQYLRERFASTETGRKQREDKTIADIYDALIGGASLAQLSTSEAWQRAPGRVKREIRDYLGRQAEHQIALANAAASRANAEETRAYTRLLRAERLEEMQGMAAYYRLSDPAKLAKMSRDQVMALLPQVGRKNLGQLLNDHDQVTRAAASGNAAAVTVDSDVFKQLAREAFGEWVNLSPSERTPQQEAQLGQALLEAKTAIAREQAAAGGKAITFERKQEIVAGVVSRNARVKIDDWFTDTELAASVVNPTDRSAAYIPLADIDAAPNVLGQAYRGYLQYLRENVPAAKGLSDAQLRTRYGRNIERAMGRRVAGGTKAEIEAALRGR